MRYRDPLPASPPLSTTIQRSDYQPPTHRIHAVKLDFTLGLESTRVVNEFVFERTGSVSALRLHGDELTFMGVSIDGRPLAADEYDVSPQHLLILQAPEKGVLRVETLTNPTANTALMGLYASRGGLFTQCESEGFRRITYFLDRPDVMATFDVVMRGDKQQFPVMLSNGNLISQRTLSDAERAPYLSTSGISAQTAADQAGEWHEAHWQDPFPKPSYLFALVAADLDCIEETIRTRSGKDALLQVYTRKEDLSQAGFALDSLKRAIFWDESRFGLELDLERFMIVAVPDFNSGAMENKGLNLFNTKFVLADPQTATDIDYDGIESVVAHEYFHNWTGNRVTCRDWFQLTLKEGLTVFRDAEFSADMAAKGLSPEQARSARAVRRIDSVRVLRTAQFPEDAGPMSHPIRPDAYEEIRNFYTATVYEKGAEVIRMLQTLLGVEGFRKGMDLYFKRHDGQAVTCEDFVQAMFDANQANEQSGKDRNRSAMLEMSEALGSAAAEQFMRWYDTSGTPRVLVTDSWNASTGEYTLNFTQQISETSPSQKPLVIPIALGLIGANGQELPIDQSMVLLTDWKKTVTLKVKTERNRSGAQRADSGLGAESRMGVEGGLGAKKVLVPSLLRDFSAPIALDYDYTDQQLLLLLAHDTDPFNRWEAGQRLMLGLMLSGHPISPQDPVLVAFRQIAADQSLDNAYKAAVLTPPSEIYAAERVHEINPAAIHSAREQLRDAMAQALREELLQIDQALAPDPEKPYSPDPLSTGRRSLFNLAQSLMARQGSISGEVLLKRYQASGNMTDRMAALQVLVERNLPQAQQALDHYLDMFSAQALAVDKWFTVQVAFNSDQALTQVRKLLQHAQFDASNPNRLRALLGTFFHQNQAGFHRADGTGYTLWVEQVLAIDARNSQLASRMARALDRWARFEPVRRAAMKAALEAVVAHEKLSPDVREVVSKSLASGA